MNDYHLDNPHSGESQLDYSKRLELEGQRELYIRKALRTHFGLNIDETIDVCAELSTARLLELQDLRNRFPELNENRLAWKISKSLTIDKTDARVWAEKIITLEGKA